MRNNGKHYPPFMAVGKNEFGSYPLAFIKNLINKKYLFNFKRHGMKKNYVMAALVLSLLAGCSTDVKESDIKFAGEAGVKVSFNAVINSQTELLDTNPSY